MKPEIKLGILAGLCLFLPPVLLFSDIFPDYSTGIKAVRLFTILLELIGGYYLAAGFYPRLKTSAWVWPQWVVWIILFVLGIIYVTASSREQGPKPEQKAAITSIYYQSNRV